MIRFASICLCTALTVGCIARTPTQREDTGVPCTLPSVGDDCYMPSGEREARQVIASRAPCVLIEVRPREFICEGVEPQVAAGGFSIPNWIDYVLDDYSIYRCSGGQVEFVWRAALLDGSVTYVDEGECREFGCDLLANEPCVGQE